MFEKLTTMNVIESMEVTIRVDKTSNLGSVIDTIRMVLECSSSAANATLGRLFLTSPELENKCRRLKINDRGNETYVANAKTLVEVVWLLPGKTAQRFVAKARERYAVFSAAI